MKFRKIGRNTVVVNFTPVSFFMMGLSLFFVGLLMIGGFAQAGSLRCVRGEEIQMCYYAHDSLLGQTVNEINVKDLKGAELVRSTDSDGDDIYSIEIQTTESSFSMDGVTALTRSEKGLIVSQINNFVKNESRSTLLVSGRLDFIPMAIGGLFCLIAVFIFIFVSKLTVYIDRHTQTLTIIKKSLIKKTMDVYGFSEIDSAFVEEVLCSDDMEYRVCLKMVNKEVVPLTSYFNSKEEEQREIAETINIYLDIFQPSAKAQ